MGSSSDALLERISNNTPKKTKKNTTTPAGANTVRRSRRLLGPSVSIVGDVGENEETPLGKIRETVTTTTTSRLGGGKGGANENNNEKKKTVRSPLMDRGNERDVITVEEEEENGKRKKEKNKTRKIINRNWQNQSWTIRYQNRVRTRRVHFVGRRKRHCGGTVLLVRRRCVTRAA